MHFLVGRYDDQLVQKSSRKNGTVGRVEMLTFTLGPIYCGRFPGDRSVAVKDGIAVLNCTQGAKRIFDLNPSYGHVPGQLVERHIQNAEVVGSGFIESSGCERAEFVAVGRVVPQGMRIQ